MKVFRTFLFVADVEKTLYRRRVRIGRKNNVLRTPGRKRTSGKLSYGPKVGRPLNVRSEYGVLWTTLAEWAWGNDRFLGFVHFKIDLPLHNYIFTLVLRFWIPELQLERINLIILYKSNLFRN